MTTLAQLYDCHSCNDERSMVQKKMNQQPIKSSPSLSRVKERLSKIFFCCALLACHEDRPVSGTQWLLCADSPFFSKKKSNGVKDAMAISTE